MNKKVVIFLMLLTVAIRSFCQSTYTPSPENLAARSWFQNAKFGLFIHWGVYSQLADGEWVMQTQDISVSQYEKLPGFFNPMGFDAKQWVSLAKAAGMKYICITTKHHDGFAMYDSKVSDYNIVDRTPYGRDIFRELEQECKKQDIKLFAYYSQLDWHHTDYYPRGWTGRKTGRPEQGNWDNYLSYQDAQIRELAENYDIAGFWFDGWWDQAANKEDWHKAVEYRLTQPPNWNLDKTYSMIHSIKPALLIGNNHHEAPFAGEDFQMFEKDLPGGNTTGFGTKADDIGQLPLETCETINHSWGFNLQDTRHKPVDDLIKYLVKAAGYNSNFLLNVGPMPNGKIQEEHITILKALGQWVTNYGETIYGTRGGPVLPQEWGVSTVKGDKIYLHVFEGAPEKILIDNLPKNMKRMRYFDDQSKVQFVKNKKGWLLDVPLSKRKGIDTIIVISQS